MKTTRIALIAFGITLAFMASGCGGGGGGGGNGSPSPSTSYLPMQVGNSWDYLMTFAPDIVPAQEPSNQLFDYHETIVGTASLNGEDYFIFRSVRDETEQYPERVWQQIRRETEDAIVARVGDPAYDLPVLMLPPTQGDTWTDPVFPDLTFTVVSVREQVTVPAGTFTCVHVDQRWEEELEGGGTTVNTTKTWFAHGVGLVKDETWEDDVKTTMIELTDYSVQ